MEEPLSEESTPMETENMDTRKRIISEKQRLHLENARRKKKEYADRDKQLEAQLTSSMGHILNRLTNIESQVSSFVSVKRYRDTETEEKPKNKKPKKEEVPPADKPHNTLTIVSDTWQTAVTNMAIKGLCVFGVSTIFNLIGYAYRRSARKTGDGDTIIFDPPI
jgi:hypothetical protein